MIREYEGPISARPLPRIDQTFAHYALHGVHDSGTQRWARELAGAGVF